MVVHNLALAECIRKINLNHLKKYYEKFSVCFSVCNDLYVLDKLPISGRYFQSRSLGRHIGRSSDYRIDHFFNKQTLGKKVNSVIGAKWYSQFYK
jgi:hypothetical protein